MKSRFLTVALGLASLAAHGQRMLTPDYLVTISGDTLRGRVVMTGRSVQTLHLRRADKPLADFTAAEAISYGDANGQLGVSQRVGSLQGELRFVTPLIKGPVSLYSGENAKGEKRFFLQPKDSAYVVEVVPTNARLTYLRVLPGCPTLDFAYSQIEGRYLYNYNGLSRLVRDYNACRYPQQTSQLIPEPGGLQTHFGVKAGVHGTRFNFPEARSRDLYTTPLSYQTGVFMNVSNKSRFSLQLEAMYMAIRGEYGPFNVYNGNAYYTTTRSLVIKYSQLQVPLLVRYTLGSGSFRPYLNTGPLYTYNFNRKSEDVYQDSDKPAVTRRVLRIPNAYSVGLTGGVGMLVQRPGLPQLSVEARVDHYIDITPTHTALRLDVGIAF
ncbi:porin family protein [Hymenobacter tenuis]